MSDGGVSKQTESLPEGLKAIVRDWLNERFIRVQGFGYPSVSDVLAMAATGTDWAGDTEQGFYAEADVTITYLRSDGTEGKYEVAGENMASLWGAVVGGWPDHA